MSDNENKKGNGNFALLMFLGLACGILTHLLFVIPIKHSIWSKIPPDERRPWFEVMPYLGDGIISIRGFFSCCYYGMFWIFFAIIATNIHAYGFEDFRDKTFAMILFMVFMFTFLGMSIWIAYQDITGTDYGNGNKDCKRRRDEDAEEKRIKKIIHDKWSTEQDIYWEKQMNDLEEISKCIETKKKSL